MHDFITDVNSPQDTGVGRLCKANECVERRDWGPLFDEFWLEGELAVMFGPRGVGKSVLAVQIADAIAGGVPMDGFVMPEDRRRVLYIDLKLTEGQFAERYTYEPDLETTRRFRHSENLYVGCPGDPSKLDEYIRTAVAKRHISTVIIDDAAELRSTVDGSRESLLVMRQLRRLVREMGLSILVIASSREPGRTGIVRETDLMRSRVLCDVADSSFALGPNLNAPGWSYLIQTRSRSGPLRWTNENAVYCRMRKVDDGDLSFLFDERFTTRYADEERLEIIDIKHRRDEGATFRQIAEDLQMPVSRVYRMFKKWCPELEPVEPAPEPEPEPELEAEPFEQVEAASPEADESHEFLAVDPPPPPDPQPELPPLRGDWPSWINRRRLEPIIDDRNVELLVESFDDRGRPQVYYTLSNKGRVTRWVRNAWGPSGNTVHPPRPTGAGVWLGKKIRGVSRRTGNEATIGRAIRSSVSF